MINVNENISKLRHDILILTVKSFSLRGKNMREQWKSKVQEMLQICQEELKKTTEIGKKMLTASKASSDLREAYEDLGTLAVSEIRKGNLNWENESVKKILEKISEKESELEVIETQVKEIKVAAENNQSSTDASHSND